MAAIVRDNACHSDALSLSPVDSESELPNPRKSNGVLKISLDPKGK